MLGTLLACMFGTLLPSDVAPDFASPGVNHCQGSFWASGNAVGGITIRDAVSQWLQGRPTKLVDTPCTATLASASARPFPRRISQRSDSGAHRAAWS